MGSGIGSFVKTNGSKSAKVQISHLAPFSSSTRQPPPLTDRDARTEIKGGGEVIDEGGVAERKLTHALSENLGILFGFTAGAVQRSAKGVIELKWWRTGPKGGCQRQSEVKGGPLEWGVASSGDHRLGGR